MFIPDELNEIHRHLVTINQELVKDGSPMLYDHDLVRFVNESAAMVHAAWEYALDKGYECAEDAESVGLVTGGGG